MRARRSRGEWTAIIEEFEESGEPHEAFCAERGLNIGSFRGWLYRLRRATSGPSTSVALLPVQVTTPVLPRVPSGIVVAVADIEVRVAVGADVDYVAGLVAELRARC
jgi:hypothetical protein